MVFFLAFREALFIGNQGRWFAWEVIAGVNLAVKRLVECVIRTRSGALILSDHVRVFRNNSNLIFITGSFQGKGFQGLSFGITKVSWVGPVGGP